VSENQQPEQVTSNHSVTDRWRCTAMEKKYGWKLLRIERNQNNPFSSGIAFSMAKPNSPITSKKPRRINQWVENT
jgi:hypothetical protein